MIINYSDNDVLMVSSLPSLFLAGPTPRSSDVKSWREDALNILESLEFSGIVYIPELKNDDHVNFDYLNQVGWEREALHYATVIVFWIPRDVKTLPGFTTNVEFGYWLSKDSSKVIYGRPDDSSGNKYLDWLYEVETDFTPENNLNSLLENAVNLMRDRAVR